MAKKQQSSPTICLRLKGYETGKVTEEEGGIMA